MDLFLIAARGLHFAATISLAGVFVFECIVARPVFPRSGAAFPARLARRLDWLAWTSLGLALISGAAWLLAVASSMSGQPLAAALTQGAWRIVLARTQFGADWLVRLGLAVAIALSLLAGRAPPIGRSRSRWAALGFALPLLAGIAWAGHGAAMPGAAGDLHLAADILHLIGAGGWLGTLLPFALLLVEAQRGDRTEWAPVARRAAWRFTTLAFVSVAFLMLGGIVNTWFLAGTIPALVGTGYGRLLLAKIALFLATLVIAAVNLLRLSPRLTNAGAVAHVLLWMRRNALAEATLGLAVLAIVALLGILPPGLHTEPGWPLPFRVDFAALSVPQTIAACLLLAAFGAAAVAFVACGAAGRYPRMALCGGGLVLCLGGIWLTLAPALEPAYPTSFYAPAEPYAAPSIARGKALYAADCALCHGAEGRGDGPAAAGLPVHPANLTAPHLLAHTPGDLFWWVGHGKANGAMPGFAAVLRPAERWDLVNFIRARTAGLLLHDIGPQISAAATPAVPDFAFETAGVQSTLRDALVQGPVLLLLFVPPLPSARLGMLAAAGQHLGAAGLQIIAVDLSPGGDEGKEGGAARSPFAVEAAPVVKATLALFRASNDGGETELLLDRSSDIRARWTANGKAGLPDEATLVADARLAADTAVAAPSHAGHGG